MLPLVVMLALSGAPSKWVALVHTTGDVPSSWRQSLREAAELNKQGGSWAPPPAVTLDEAQLALGCSGWTHQCAGQIAAMTGAAVALVIDVEAKDPGVVLIVQAVKSNGANLGSEERLELPGRTDKDLEFAKDFVKNQKAQRSGYLLVDSDVPGADVSLDGAARGKTPWKELVDAGEHRLIVSAEGRAPYTKTIKVKPGVLTSEIVPLSAAGPAVGVTPTVGEPDHVVKTEPALPPTAAPQAPDTSVVGWSLAAGGGVIAAVSSVFAGAAIYDRFFNRIPCGKDNADSCVPNVPLLFGIYSQGGGRGPFESDSSAWIGGGIAAVGVGALLIGTGVVLATGDQPAEGAAPADAEAPAEAAGR